MKQAFRPYLTRFYILILLTSVLLNSTCIAAENNQDFVIHYENTLITFPDQQPVILNSRTLVPVRIVEDLGFNVVWDALTRSVIVSNDTKTLTFVIDSSYVYHSDEIFLMDVEAAILNSRTMIPLRFLVEGFDMSIGYRQDNGIHYIDIYNQPTYGHHKGIILGPNGETDGIFNDQIFRSLEVDPDNSDVVVVGTEANGFFKSIDGGQTWKWYREGLLIEGGALPVYPEYYDISIASDNTTYFAAFATSPGPAEGTYPSAAAGVYVSEDGGQTWNRRIKGLISGTVGAVAAHPSDPSIAYCGVTGGMPSFSGWNFVPEYYPGGIFKTEDAGLTWTQISTLEKASTSDYFRIKTYGDNTVMALGSKFYEHEEAAGLMISHDSGLSFESVNPSGVYFGDFDNYDDQVIYGLSEDKGSPLGIYKTTDGGENWTKTNANGYGAIRVSPHDKDLVLYSSRDKLYLSTNGLATSKLIMSYDSTVPNAIITDIVFSPSDENVVYLGGPGLRIYKSTDKGQTFELMVNLRETIEYYRTEENGLYQSLIDSME